MSTVPLQQLNDDYEKIIDAATRVRDLRQELFEAEVRLDVLLGFAPPAEDEPQAEPEREPASIPKQVLRILRSDPMRVWSIAEITERCTGPSANAAYIAGQLAEMVGGAVARVERGRYRYAGLQDNGPEVAVLKAAGRDRTV